MFPEQAHIKPDDTCHSSLNPPLDGFGEDYLYPKLFDIVAAIAFRVAQNHAFHDGNKRTALLITEAVLEWNGFEMSLSQDGKIVAFSLVGSGFLGQEGLRHALILACGLDPLSDNL